MNLNSSTQQNLYNHQEIFNHLSKLYLNNKLPNKILLSGEKGIGKATLGYHLTNFVLSEDEENPYDIKNNEINLENKSFKLIQNINTNPFANYFHGFWSFYPSAQPRTEINNSLEMVNVSYNCTCYRRHFLI